MSTLSTLRTYQVVPAIPAVASYLQQLLAPVISACRFSSPPPVELRATGSTWRGWCAELDMAPDGRVCLSSRARFWLRHELIAGYLYESARRRSPASITVPCSPASPMLFCLAPMQPA